MSDLFSARANSPAWHRRARHQRHQARVIASIHKAYETLQKHHSAQMVCHNTWKCSQCSRNVKNWHSRCLCGQHYSNNGNGRAR
eukprot:3079333-Pyramimonas_sp.AAC.1